MNIFTGNFKLFVYLLIIGPFVFHNAQYSHGKTNDFDKLHALAGTLLESGQYYNAITEYKRALYKHGDINGLVNQKIAYGYLQLDEFENSIEYIDRAMANADTDSEKSKINLNKAVILLSFGKYNDAIHIATREYYFSYDVDVKCRAASLLVFSYVLSANFKEAAAFSSKNKHIADKCKQFQTISSSLNEIGTIVHKDPKRARRLSMAMPGLGQAYSGNYFQGINALITNAGLAFFLVNRILHADYANATLALALLQSFYRGNVSRAFHMTVEYNDSLNDFIIREIIKDP